MTDQERIAELEVLLKKEQEKLNAAMNFIKSLIPFLPDELKIMMLLTMAAL